MTKNHSLCEVLCLYDSLPDRKLFLLLGLYENGRKQNNKSFRGGPKEWACYHLVPQI